MNTNYFISCVYIYFGLVVNLITNAIIITRAIIIADMVLILDVNTIIHMAPTSNRSLIIHAIMISLISDDIITTHVYSN